MIKIKTQTEFNKALAAIKGYEMNEQIIKTTITTEKTVLTITPVDINKAKIRFMNFTDHHVRAYFEDETHLTIEGGSGEIELMVYEVK